MRRAYLKVKHFFKNLKMFWWLLVYHRNYDYESFFIFMDAFLQDHIDLQPTFVRGRDKLVKKLKVMKELNNRIHEDRYLYQVTDYNEGAKNFEDSFTDKDIVFEVKRKDYIFQRQRDMEYYTYLINKYLFYCWD